MIRDDGAKRALTEGEVTRALLLFSLPVLGSSALQSLNGTVNQFWISHSLDINALTAVGASNVVMMLLIGASFGAGLAANILIARNVGAGTYPMVKRVMGTCFTFFAIVSLSVGLLGYLMTPWILDLIHMPAEALAPARIYLRILFVSMPFLYFFAFLQMAQRGIGDSRTPFYFILLAVGLDIVLNPLLIRGLGPFPRLGIAGSALSTLISQAVALSGLVMLLYHRQSPLMLHRGEAHLLKPDLTLLGSLLFRGLPMSLQMMVLSGSAVAMFNLVNGFGAITAAAFTAASQLWNYLQMPAMAIGMSISAMAAQNIGAGRWDRVGKIAASGVLLGSAITGAMAILLFLLDDLPLRLFLPIHSPALPEARHLNRIVIWSFEGTAVTLALSGVVRSTGAVWIPMGILAFGMFAVRIPVAKLLMPSLGADALWWSFGAGAATTSVLMALYYCYGPWRRVRMLGPPKPVPAVP